METILLVFCYAMDMHLSHLTKNFPYAHSEDAIRSSPNPQYKNAGDMENHAFNKSVTKVRANKFRLLHLSGTSIAVLLCYAVMWIIVKIEMLSNNIIFYAPTYYLNSNHLIR